MADLTSILEDLAAEGADLDRLVADLPAEKWATPTSAAGWSIAHQIAHLAWTDDAALASATDPGRFDDIVRAAWANPNGFVDEAAEEGAHAPDLLARWREGRAGLAAVLAAVAPGRKLDWFGPPMSAASMATARVMETWAHGQDVADALGVTRAPTARLRHVAHIGVRTRDFAYVVNQQVPPTAEFRVELASPDGEKWTWGPENAGQRLTGPALDFCLLVTQRRHRDDLALVAEGPDVEHWLTVAQAFAGPPGGGREPGRSSR